MSNPRQKEKDVWLQNLDIVSMQLDSQARFNVMTPGWKEWAWRKNQRLIHYVILFHWYFPCLEQSLMPRVKWERPLLSIADGVDEASSRAVTLSEAADHTLQSHCSLNLAVVRTGCTSKGVKSNSEYLALHSYWGLELHHIEMEKVSPEVGSKGM